MGSIYNKRNKFIDLFLVTILQNSPWILIRIVRLFIRVFHRLRLWSNIRVLCNKIRCIISRNCLYISHFDNKLISISETNNLTIKGAKTSICKVPKQNEWGEKITVCCTKNVKISMSASVIYLKAISKHSLESELSIFSIWTLATPLKFEPSNTRYKPRG
jgi:hypothetical protein